MLGCFGEVQEGDCGRRGGCDLCSGEGWVQGMLSHEA